MSVTIFFIFLGIIGNKILNAYIISTWIHRLTSVNKQIFNFLIGFVIQMAMFAVVLILSYFINFTLINVFYLVIFVQVIIWFLGIINFHYLLIWKKSNAPFWLLLVFMVVIGVLNIVFVALWPTYLINRSLIPNQNTRLVDINSVQNIWWSNQLIFTGLNYFAPHVGQSLMHASNYLSLMEFSLLYALLFFLLFKERIIFFNKLEYLWYFVFGLVSWGLLFWSIIVYVKIYWFIFYCIIVFVILTNKFYYQNHHYLLLSNFLVLSNLYYNYAAFYWVLSVSLFVNIYYIVTKNEHLIFHFLTSLITALYALIFLLLYNSLLGLQPNQAILIPVLIGVFCLGLVISGWFLLCYCKNMLQNQFYRMHQFALKHGIRVLLILSFIAFFTYVFYLSFNYYADIWLVLESLVDFSDRTNLVRSFLNLVYFISFWCILLGYGIIHFVLKKPIIALSQANLIAILVINNPISYLTYIFLISNLGNLDSLIVEIDNNSYFPFLIFIVINFFLSYFNSCKKHHKNHQDLWTIQKNLSKIS